MNAAAGAEVRALMQKLGQAAVAAAVPLARSSTATRNDALRAAAAALRARSAEILAANEQDMRAARAENLSAARP